MTGYLYFHPRDRDFVQANYALEKYEAHERDDVPPGRVYITTSPIEGNYCAQVGIAVMRQLH